MKAKKALEDVTFAKENPSPTHTLWNEPKDPVRWANPSDLWNVRKAIGYGLQKAAAGEDGHMRAAAARLSPFMDDLAHHIDQGAPGFHDYLAGYSQRSGTALSSIARPDAAFDKCANGRKCELHGAQEPHQADRKERGFGCDQGNRCSHA